MRFSTASGIRILVTWDSCPSHLAQHVGLEDMPVSALEHEPLFPTKNRPARVSVIFNGQHNTRLGDTLPDVIVQSSDDVYFAVHSDQIASTSTNEFASLILTNSIHAASNPAELSVQESSEVLHGLFCSVYGLPPESRRPSLASVRATFDALQKYGMTPLELYVYQDTFLYKAILVHAHEHAFEAYALAGEYGIEDLAVATSAETIRLEVHTLQSDLAGIMGVSYLYRLHNLHAARDTQLRKILRVAPKVHLAKSYCLDAAQQSIRTTFYSACAKLLWRFPNVSRDDISNELGQVLGSVTCQDCKAILTAETDGIIAAWNDLQTTI